MSSVTDEEIDDCCGRTIPKGTCKFCFGYKIWIYVENYQVITDMDCPHCKKVEDKDEG